MITDEDVKTCGYRHLASRVKMERTAKQFRDIGFPISGGLLIDEIVRLHLETLALRKEYKELTLQLWAQKTEAEQAEAIKSNEEFRRKLESDKFFQNFLKRQAVIHAQHQGLYDERDRLFKVWEELGDGPLETLEQKHAFTKAFAQWLTVGELIFKIEHGLP